MRALLTRPAAPVTFEHAPRPAHVNARHLLKILLAAGLLGLAVFLLTSGVFGRLDPRTLQAELRATGALGVFLYLGLLVFVQPIGPSGHLFVVAAGLVWPAPFAFAVSLVGATLGHTLYFLIYRYLAFGWAQTRVPARLRRFERAFIERPLRSVILLRLLTFTWPLAPALLGVSRVYAAPMIVGTLLGLAPGIALDVWLGSRVLAWLWP